MGSKSAAAAFGGRASFADLWNNNGAALMHAYPAEGRMYDASQADAALAPVGARMAVEAAFAWNGPAAGLAALGLPVHKLPSTSPANASWSLERKLSAWREILMQYGLCK